MARFRWLRISDPDAEMPDLDDRVAMRALVSADADLDPVADKLSQAGVTVRRMSYLVEDEEIYGDDEGGELADSRECHLNRPRKGVHVRSSGAAAEVAVAAFEADWQALEASASDGPAGQPVERLVPAQWAEYFTYPSFNPAQAQAAPEILGSEENLVVVAPTGSGKTVIGMTAALKVVLGTGRKAAWLVPQRSLTDELDRDLDLWRRRGLRIERLSGEHRADLDRLREAHLWISTTEKFESICRTGSLREVLEQVSVLIVDEIHLVGDPVRGPTLEGVLARMRDVTGGPRLVGLSATVTNSAEIAAWLRARLVTIAWRPGRLTWQLPIIAAHQDWNVTEAARTRLASTVTTMVAADGGGVLVFCGSKRNVRLTALVIAAARGADVRRIRIDDVDEVHEVCRRVGVGLHYKGWDHRAEAEAGFRKRRLDILVATTTVAVGVNLPARAVVIRDTQIGFGAVDVATVLQMFGRAGRAGAGEQDGWAYLIVDEHEHTSWRAQLAAGYTVSSQIQANLPEQVLSEVVQDRIASQLGADQWWIRTLAHHQGSRGSTPLHDAVRFLRSSEMLVDAEPVGGPVVASELGRLTARLMISPEVGDKLRRALADLPLPSGPDEAERLMIQTLATAVPKLAQAVAGDAVKPAVARLLGAAGPTQPGSVPGGSPGDLAQASMLAVTAPGVAPFGDRLVAGIPYSAMYPVLEDAPRYLHWLGSQGVLGTVHPWCAVTAADLGRRLRWRRCAPARGAGRLLWMLEQMSNPARVEQDVPTMWQAATARGVTSPDWPSGRRPDGCALDEQAYAALLRDRATDCRLSEYPRHAFATGAPGSVVVTWSGPRWRLTPVRRRVAEAPYPDGDPAQRGAALFTWRGDHLATSWPAVYAAASSTRPRPR
ncbi:DEAD/DEAH box helicase [Micromonospora arborensis]|uniref:DEAD/DEAH box helicase n=1 Tax=Micromonospora arborensis TaxID=2116518 RepID=UPI003438DCE4